MDAPEEGASRMTYLLLALGMCAGIVVAYMLVLWRRN